jgi:hypothetical protein
MKRMQQKEHFGEREDQEKCFRRREPENESG